MQQGSDHIGRLTDLTVNLPGTASDNLETFTYNPTRQIASRAQTNDLYAFPVAASFDRSYTANGRNQYTAAGPATFAYDANGNLSQSTAPNASSVSVTTTYHYDVENRMVGLDDGTTNAMLRYDPLGRLYEMWTSATGTKRYLRTVSRPVASEAQAQAS